MGCVDALLASRALFDAAIDPHITHNSIPQGFTRFLVCIALVCGHRLLVGRKLDHDRPLLQALVANLVGHAAY
jgi:hypothetical protein